MNIFRKWMASTGLKNSHFIKATGMSDQNVSKIRNMDVWSDPVKQLALSAIAAGLEPWAPENAHEAEALRPVLDAIRQAAPQTCKKTKTDMALAPKNKIIKTRQKVL